MSDTQRLLQLIQSYDITNCKYAETFDEIQRELRGVSSFENLNIFCMNIRSLQKNYDELNILLHNSQNVYDLIILTETWQLSNTNFQIQNYNLYYNSGKINQNDGVVVYIRSDLVPKVNLITLNEITFSKIQFSKYNKSFNILACYRPPSTNPQLFLNDLEILLNDSNYDVNIFAGDINFDITDKKHTETNEYINLLCENGFYPKINKPTRIFENSKSCLDHFFLKTRNDCHQTKSFILESSITDHYPIILNISFNKLKVVDKDLFIKHSTINYDGLLKSLTREKWLDVLTCQDSNLAYNLFLIKYNHIINKNSKTHVFKKKIKHNRPWINDQILKSIKTRDKLKKISSLEPNNVHLKNYYKKYRNTTTKLIRVTKNNYYKQNIFDAKNNPKKIWETINDFTSSNEPDKEINKIESENGLINTNSIEICNILNSYFNNIGYEMAKTIVPQIEPKIYNEKHIKESLFLFPATEYEVKTYINGLKNNCVGPDDIKTETLKQSQDHLIKPLAHITNLTLSTGIFPDLLKKSTIKPIFKSGDPLKPKNYRPISLVSNFSKIIEKTIKNRIINHLDNHKVISENQYGFKKGLSTTDSIYAVTHEIHKILNGGKRPLVVFLDLAKAFDTISHDLLLSKLRNIGLRGISESLIRDYLINRYQRTSIANFHSNYAKNLNFGIPQGTVLGPVLFQIYINNLINLKIPGKIITFADDTVLIFSGETWEQAKENAEIGFSVVYKWLSANLLTLNIEKTKFMTFSLNNALYPDMNSITLHNCIDYQQCVSCSHKIYRVKEIKYLGIKIDTFLKWNLHIEMVVSKLRRLIHKFYQLREILNQKLLRTIYFALVQSIITYAIPIWGNTFETAIHPLKILQKRIFKIMIKKPLLYPSESLFLEIGLFNIQLLYVQNTLIFIKKNVMLKKKISHQYNTRINSLEHMKLEKPNNSTYSRSVDYFGIKLYNILPYEIRKIHSLILFKRKVTSFIKNNSIYILNEIHRLKELS